MLFVFQDSKSKEFYIKDENGNILEPGNKYTRICPCNGSSVRYYSYYEGYLGVDKSSWQIEGIKGLYSIKVYNKLDNYKVIFMRETDTKIEGIEYKETAQFNDEGFARVTRGTKQYGYVDTTGREVVASIYSMSESIEKLKEYKLQKLQKLQKLTNEQISKGEVAVDEEKIKHRIIAVDELKMEYTQKINKAYDRDASEEEIEKILEEYKIALAKLSATKENKREATLKRLDEITEAYICAEKML